MSKRQSETRQQPLTQRSQTAHASSKVSGKGYFAPTTLFETTLKADHRVSGSNFNQTPRMSATSRVTSVIPDMAGLHVRMTRPYTSPHRGPTEQLKRDMIPSPVSPESDKRTPEFCTPLTEENLRKHVEATKESTNLIEFISNWRARVEPTYPNEQLCTETTADGKRPNSRSSPKDRLDGDLNKRKRILASAAKSQINNHQFQERAASPSDQLQRSLPILPSFETSVKSRNNNVPIHSAASKRHVQAEPLRPEATPTNIAIATSSPQQRGKLLCCLKIEIKAGVFRILPVHENDVAYHLAFEFCRTHNLLNSVEALTGHIQSSMHTFGLTALDL